MLPYAVHRVSWLRLRAEEGFVALVWCVAAVVLVSYVGQHAGTLPFTDDVLMGRYLDPTVDIDLHVLWAQHNEHRIPLPKLLYMALVGGFRDLRAGCWFHVLALLAVSLGLLLVLRERTGRWRVSDASIPLALLTAGNAENLLNSFQVAFALPFALMGTLLAMSLAGFEPRTAARQVPVWAVLLLLVGCGGVGVVYAGVLALWPIGASIRAARARQPGWRGLLLAGAAGGVALALAVAAYFHDLVPMAAPAVPGPSDIARTAFQYLACGAGALAMQIEPWPGWLAAAALFAGALSVIRGLRAGAPAASAVAAQLAAGAVLAVVVGIGRAADGPNAGFANRYVELSALLLCTSHLALRSFARGAWARLAELVLFACLLAWSLGGHTFALNLAHGRAIIQRRFEEQARQGAGIEELARANWRGFFYGEEAFADELRAWQRAGFLEDVRPGERLVEVEGVRPSALLPGTLRGLEHEVELEPRGFGGRYALVTRGALRIELAVPPGARSLRMLVANEPAGQPLRYGVQVTGDGTLLLESEVEALEQVPAGARIVVPLSNSTPERVDVRFYPLPGPRGWLVLSAVRFTERE